MHIRVAVFVAASLAAAGGAGAADTGELWEVSTTMDVPGMPAGMGAQRTRVCSGKDQSPGAGRSDCKVTERKRSGLTETLTVSCPDGRMRVEMTYNAARTEYKGKIEVIGGRRDEQMTMVTSGRKVGACDPALAQRQMGQQAAAASAQAERMRAEGAKAQAELDREMERRGGAAKCKAAAEAMAPAKDISLYTNCADNRPENPQQAQFCAMMRQASPAQFNRDLSACVASRTEYCKRYRSFDGFQKAKGDREGAALCGTTREQVLGSLCPRATESEQLSFLAYCAVEGKPVAQKHCAGRSYTSASKDRYSDFCYRYVALHGPVEGEARGAASSSRSSGSSTADKVQDGMQQGLNKLKGLFGR